MLNGYINQCLWTVSVASILFIFNPGFVAAAQKAGAKQFVCPEPVHSCTGRWKYSRSQSQEFERDEKLFLDTLFPDNEEEKNKHYPDEEKRRNFMKRLFITLAYGKFESSTDPYGQQANWKPWPYPLAVALSHGQRVVIQIEGEHGEHVIKGQQFLNLLTTGNEKFLAPFVKNRSAASHGFSYEKDDLKNPLKEIKLKGVKGTAKNIKLGVEGKHFGINVAYGGLGAQGCNDKETVGPGGLILVYSPYNPEAKMALKNRQHGHFYLQYFDAAPNITALMIGLEENEAGSASMFNIKHTPLSAIQDSKTIPAITGGKKMACFLTKDAPAQYGGMRLTLKQQEIEDLRRLFVEILKPDVTIKNQQDIQEQKAFFSKLLGAKNAPEAKKILLGHMTPKRASAPPPARPRAHQKGPGWSTTKPSSAILSKRSSLKSSLKGTQ